MNNMKLKVLLLVIMFLAAITLDIYTKASARSISPPKKEFFSNCISDSEKMIDTNSVIDYAKNYIGVRYVYGGASPNAFDCSGFTMYVMSNFGIDLPHSASGQSRYGTRVEREDLILGDLVFFATFGGRSITHVGLYIGENSFIHSASRGVTINNLDESYYKRSYVTAVRLIEQ